MRLFKIKILLLVSILTFVTSSKSYSQTVIIDAIKEAAKKVIRAIDLQIQRIQNHTIELQNIQKQLENTLSKLKLDEIANWTEKQKHLYQDYFDELWRVKAILTYYRQFSDIISKQKQLFGEYKQAYLLAGQDKNFSQAELEYMHGVYAGILDASLNDVDDILNLMKSFTVQMSDAARLELISKTSDAIDVHLSVLRQFNQHNQLLSLQRAKSQDEINIIKKLYGLQ
jgi:hypothetical protein